METVQARRPCCAISSNRKIRRYRLTRIRPFAGLSQLDGSAASETGPSLRCSRTRGCRAGRRCRTVWRRIHCRRALQQKVSQLSGSEAESIAAGGTGAQRGKLLLLDEPTSHLDLYAQAALARAVAYRPGPYSAKSDATSIWRRTARTIFC